jgi:hypothetical protein
MYPCQCLHVNVFMAMSMSPCLHVSMSTYVSMSMFPYPCLLSRQTINGNRRLLCEQTCTAMLKYVLYRLNIFHIILYSPLLQNLHRLFWYKLSLKQNQSQVKPYNFPYLKVARLQYVPAATNWEQFLGNHYLLTEDHFENNYFVKKDSLLISFCLG